jgi:hypothetical protein
MPRGVAQETGAPTGATIGGVMPTTPKNAVARLGELLAARMRRNSRLSLHEALVAEGGFFEPDDELIGHLILHRRELSYWMRAALEGKPREGRRE